MRWERCDIMGNDTCFHLWSEGVETGSVQRVLHGEWRWHRHDDASDRYFKTRFGASAALLRAVRGG